MMKSFLFNTENNISHDTVIYLVLQRKVLQHGLFIYLLLTDSDLLKNKTTYRYTSVPPVMGVGGVSL